MSGGTSLPPSTPGISVLVVEDERIISLALASMLRGLGLRVAACVPSGEAALELLRHHTPDLVLLDIHLEGELDGIATAQAMRERNGPPVAFTTAYTDSETIRRAMALEPLAFLAKPLAPHDIQKLVAGLAGPDGRVER